MTEVTMDVMVVGLTMVIVEIIKRLCKRVMTEETVKQIVVPLAVFAIAGALNVGACALFTPDVAWRAALLEGLKWGAIAGGIFSLGKAALGKS